MTHRSICVLAMAAFALLIALVWLCASAPAQAKAYLLEKKPRQVQPPAVHLIKCAASYDGSPCWPDPGMLRLDRAPPQFVPSR